MKKVIAIRKDIEVIKEKMLRKNNLSSQMLAVVFSNCLNKKEYYSCMAEIDREEIEIDILVKCLCKKTGWSLPIVKHSLDCLMKGE